MKVRVIKKKTEKPYLEELLRDEYQEWKGKKILISAPTGMGKTTFVVETLLNDARMRGKKLIILCNRRLLRLQYWYGAVKKFTDYSEIDKCVKILTYQEVAEMIKRQVSIKKFLDEYETVVCDEAHYFYADSDFNPLGTYVLLQELTGACATKSLIFMSATMDKVRPLIVQTIKNCLSRLSRTGRRTEIRDMNEQILEYDFSTFADYARFQCACVPDWETLCQLLVESPKKSVIFVNDKKKGCVLAEQMIKTGKIERMEIAVLNADNLDSDSEVIQELAICNRLRPKILITTAVLDNGVSIHDSEVGNVLIETESKIEFLQMLGRVRAELVDECKLYFVQRDKKEFLNRKNQYEAELGALKKLTSGELRTNREFYIQTLWDDDNTAKFYRKVLVWMKFDSQFYVWPENETLAFNKKFDFYVNEFARHKIGDMYVAESRFYALALEGPLKVIYEQMAWIDKEPDELQVLQSEYLKMREQEFVGFLLEVQNYTPEDLKEYKKVMVRKYRKDFFADILANNGTISNDKLQMICERYGLIFEDHEDPENRRKLYSIKIVERDLREE